MIDLHQLDALALDVADVNSSYDRQDEVSEVIWQLLDRDYQIYLLSTKDAEALEQETFMHPGLTIVNLSMPPEPELLHNHPRLQSPKTLWVTDDQELQHWIHEKGMPFAHVEETPHPFHESMRLQRLGDLASLLNPIAFVMEDVERAIRTRKPETSNHPLVVGLGGPPTSQLARFVVDLKRYLESLGHPLVELLDLSSLLHDTESLELAPGGADSAWRHPDASMWVRESLLAPLREGREVYHEKAPALGSEAFEAHFPLYLAPGAVVLLFAEMVHQKVLSTYIDLSVLLDVEDREITRRQYEIPLGEAFDDSFTAQYLSREGRHYAAYLAREQTRKRVTVLIDANRPVMLKTVRMPAADTLVSN